MKRTPSSPLRVLVIAPFGVLGGAERWLLRLLDATQRAQVRGLLLGDGPLRGELRRRGIAVRVRETGRSPAAIGAAILALARDLRTDRPDVVLANGVKAAAVAVPAAKLTGVPVVWAKHDHSFDAQLARPLALLSDRVVAAVEELAEPTGRGDAVIIPPPRAEPPPASADEARRFWADRGVPLTSPTLAMVTRLVPYKGVDDAIRAVAERETWQLVVVGEHDPAAPDEAERLRRLAGDLGVRERVRFSQPVPDVAHWLAAFDALAVLSKPDERGLGREGFGTVAFEAMLAVVPVIAVEGGAVTRRLAGIAGVSVPPGDPAAVAGALDALRDPQERRRAGRAGRELVAAYPNAETCAEQLMTVLASAAARPGAGLPDGPAVSVVVTVRDDGPALDELLGGLVPQLRSDDELVIVDGGSGDDTVARARRWAVTDDRIRVLASPGANIPAGRNRGIEAAVHGVICCTDAGCTPEPGWLDALRTPFAGSIPPGLVTGLYRVSETAPFGAAMAAAAYPDPEEARAPDALVRAYGALLGRVFDPTMPTGRSVAFTAAAWKAVGGFPEDLDTGEDVTFGRAISAAGYPAVLQADAEVRWRQRPTLGGTARMFYRYGIGDGRSRDPRLIGRNLLRIAAYLGGAALAARGGRGARLAVSAGAAAYLSLPLRRALRRPRPALVGALVPAALALKDLAKAAGCVAGMLRGQPSER